MVRFPCPTCGKVLRAQDDKAGRSGVCPRCGERVVAPGGAPPQADSGTGESSGEPQGLLAGMSLRVRCVASVLALVAVFGMLAIVSHPLLPEGAFPGEFAGPWTVWLSASSFMMLGVIFYGQATGCPSCGRWWSRERAGQEFLGREVFDKEGVPYGRSTYRTTYLCSSCQHRWSVDETEEYRASSAGQGRPQRARARG
jgi:DNA-directed RNA polymerase subunit RPC12/RpoP